MATTNLETTQFVPIQPGQTIETEIDVAELYGMLALLDLPSQALTHARRRRDFRQLYRPSSRVHAVCRTEQHHSHRQISSILEQRSHHGH